MSRETNQHELPNQEKWITLTRSEVKHIFVYYIVLFLISLVTMIAFIWHFALAESGEIKVIETVLFSLVLYSKTVQVLHSIAVQRRRSK